MLQLIAWTLGGLTVLLAAAGVTAIVGLRTKSPTVRRVVRGFARTVVNPRMLKTAGTLGAGTSIIQHVGRTSGRRYRTPVVAAPTDDGFVIALPYGTTSNWVQNVLAAGCATLVRDGRTYALDRPEVMPLALLADRFPANDQRSHARFRVDECIRLHHPDLHGTAQPSP